MVRDTVARIEQSEPCFILMLAGIGIEDIGNVYAVIPAAVYTGYGITYRADIPYMGELDIPYFSGSRRKSIFHPG